MGGNDAHRIFERGEHGGLRYVASTGGLTGGGSTKVRPVPVYRKYCSTVYWSTNGYSRTQRIDLAPERDELLL